MRRLAFFMIVALSGVGAFGQGLLDCVDPDVLRALLLPGQGGRTPVITAAVPPELAALRMPGGFTWIGSAERISGRVDATTDAVQVTAAWRSGLAPEAANAATAAALATSGWNVRTQGMGPAVFSVPGFQLTRPACRDGRPVNFSATAMDGVTYVLLTLQRGSNNNMMCNQPERFAGLAGSAVESFLPRLDVPVDPATGTVARLSSSNVSYGGSTISSSAEIIVKDSASSIARHFARQMTEQGWTSDANWSGATTAGSTWSKRPEAGALVQGTLSVMAVDERQVVTVLRVIKLQ